MPNATPAPFLDPLAAVLALLDAGDALAAAAGRDDRRRLSGRSAARRSHLPADGWAGLLREWRAAVADVDECLPLLAEAMRPWIPAAAPPATPATAAAPALDRAA